MNFLSPTDIDGYEKVASRFVGNNLSAFSNVVQVTYTRFDEGGDYAPQLELVLAHTNDFKLRIGVRFSHAIVEQISDFFQIVLYFTSIRERGWEKLNFEVGDYENESIRLRCERIEFFLPH